MNITDKYKMLVESLKLCRVIKQDEVYSVYFINDWTINKVDTNKTIGDCAGNLPAEYRQYWEYDKTPPIKDIYRTLFSKIFIRINVYAYIIQSINTNKVYVINKDGIEFI